MLILNAREQLTACSRWTQFISDLKDRRLLASFVKRLNRRLAVHPNIEKLEIKTVNFWDRFNTPLDWLAASETLGPMKRSDTH